MDTTLTKGESTKQAILTAACSLFIEQGFHATSMRQIARRSNTSLSGIYNHFTSKEAIFTQVLLDQHPYRQMLDILNSSEGDSPEEFVRNAARTITAELGRRPDFLKLVFIEISEFQGLHAPHLARTIIPQVLPLIERFGKDKGELRALPPQAILLSFVGIFISYYLAQTALDRNAFPALDPLIASVAGPGTLEPYVEIFLHGILKAEKP